MDPGTRTGMVGCLQVHQPYHEGSNDILDTQRDGGHSRVKTQDPRTIDAGTYDHSEIGDSLTKDYIIKDIHVELNINSAD